VNCPRCGLNLEVKEIQEFDGFALVHRYCLHCRITWILKHQGGFIVSVTQEGVTTPEVGETPGFDYKCPHCGFESTVYTALQVYTGWKCLQCGKIVPNEYLKPRGDFRLTPPRVIVSRSRGGTRRVSTYQRAPRVSRPIPAGAIPLAQLAQEMKVEPKRLRSWLRKVGWRKPEEAGSGWYFSPDEAKEVAKNFGR